MVLMELDVCLPVIGVARTSYQEPETTPIQAGLNRDGRGIVEIAEPYREGLDGLADFDYAWLLSWLHRPRDPAGDAPMRQVPFLLRRQRRAMGIFATRGPRRINPVGLSLIQILEVTGQAVVFAGVDLLDGTPVLETSSRTSPALTGRPEIRDAAGSTSSPSATGPRPGSSPDPSRKPGQHLGQPAGRAA